MKWMVLIIVVLVLWQELRIQMIENIQRQDRQLIHILVVHETAIVKKMYGGH